MFANIGNLGSRGKNYEWRVWSGEFGVGSSEWEILSWEFAVESLE